LNCDAGGLALWDRLKKREDGPLGVGDAPSEQLAIEILGGVLVVVANSIQQKAPGGYLSTFDMGGSIRRSTTTEKFEGSLLERALPLREVV
jgi:hypothetical protein